MAPIDRFGQYMFEVVTNNALHQVFSSSLPAALKQFNEHLIDSIRTTIEKDSPHLI